MKKAIFVLLVFLLLISCKTLQKKIYPYPKPRFVLYEPSKDTDSKEWFIFAKESEKGYYNSFCSTNNWSSSGCKIKSKDYSNKRGYFSLKYDYPQEAILENGEYYYFDWKKKITIIGWVIWLKRTKKAIRY